jgi:hypothetical protein
MADLYASVDGTGQLAPLSECTWVFSYACGHPFGVLTAQLPGSTRDSYATEQQAWKEFYGTNRAVDRAWRRGVQLRLAHLETLRADDEFWRHLRDGCECVPGRNRRGR